MGALGKKLRSLEGGGLAFWCPGCREPHAIRVSGNGGQGWNWNGNVDTPTFTPSVLVRCGHYDPRSEASRNGSCWCTYNAQHPDNPSGFSCHQCHSFVTNGQIQFLSDSTHNLGGKTVTLPDWPEDEE